MSTTDAPSRAATCVYCRDVFLRVSIVFQRRLELGSRGMMGRVPGVHEFGTYWQDQFAGRGLKACDAPCLLVMPCTLL